MAFLLKNIKNATSLTKQYARGIPKNNRGAAYVSPGTILKKMAPEADFAKIKIPQVPMRSEAASYATALYAITKGTTYEEPVEEDMEALSELFHQKGGKQLTYVLKNPESSEILDSITEGLQSEYTKGFFDFLNDQNKLGLLPEISKLYTRIGEEARGETPATITLSKLPTREFLVEKVAQANFMANGTPISLDIQIDPSIGLGYKIQVGDRIFDASAELYLASLSTSIDELERRYKSENSESTSEVNTVTTTSDLPTQKPPPALNLPPFLGLGKEDL